MRLAHNSAKSEHLAAFPCWGVCLCITFAHFHVIFVFDSTQVDWTVIGRAGLIDVAVLRGSTQLDWALLGQADEVEVRFGVSNAMEVGSRASTRSQPFPLRGGGGGRPCGQPLVFVLDSPPSRARGGVRHGDGGVGQHLTQSRNRSPTGWRLRNSQQRSTRCNTLV